MEILKSVSLKRFKIFDDRNFDFAPITILTGPNSSGKSSLLKAIVAVLQTPTTPPFPFQLKTNGQSISLGGFKEILHHQAKSRTFGLGVAFENDGSDISLYGEYRYATRGRELLIHRIDIQIDKVKLELRWGGQDKGYRARSSGESMLFDNPEDVKTFVGAMKRAFDDDFFKAARQQANPEQAFNNIAQTAENIRSNWEKWQKISSNDPVALINEIAKNVSSVALENTRAQMAQFSQLVNYVAAIRAYPQRFYGAGDIQDKVDTKGRNSIAILYEWKRRYPKRFDRVVQGIREIGVAVNLNTDQLEDDILRLNVNPFTPSRKASNLVDVGFGVSQIIPILISDEALGDRGVLIANQPEVHLHPQAQAAFGDYMARRLPKRQYIVETHSEYIINRLRKLVVTGSIQKEAVKIIHFEPASKTRAVKIHTISIAKDGRLVGAPRHYFDTYARDSFDVTMASIGGNS